MTTQEANSIENCMFEDVNLTEDPIEELNCATRKTKHEEKVLLRNYVYLASKVTQALGIHEKMKPEFEAFASARQAMYEAWNNFLVKIATYSRLNKTEGDENVTTE